MREYLKQYSLWRYVGPGFGHRDIQRVLYADRDEVITVTEAADPYNINWSWMGTLDQFLDNFIPFCGPAAYGHR